MPGPFAIPLCVPKLDGFAREYVLECFDTNFVSSVGPFVERFEQAFARFLGASHAVACASGTAALHLAMRVLGVGPGDDVLVPTFTFAASVNAVLYVGARPVLVDCEPRTWNLDPQRVVSEIESRAREGRALPKAVEVAHILGHPAELEAIEEVCARHAIPLVEDAAEALGARYTGGRFVGRQVGTLGRIGCFSFNGNKIITTGNGGMLVSDDAGLAERARHLSRQAKLPGSDYDHDDVGYNYRLSNLAAALGLAQLERLPVFLERKRGIAARYAAALGETTGVTPAPRASWADPSFWLYSIRIGARSSSTPRLAREALAAAGIESRSVWRPAHRIRAFRGLPVLGGFEADRLFSEGLSLPSSVQLAEADQQRVIEVLIEALSRPLDR